MEYTFSINPLYTEEFVMFNLADLTEGNERLRALLEDEEGEQEVSVSVEQKIEVETEVAEEQEVVEEVEESVEETEEVVEASESLLMAVERAEAVMEIIREHGYTKPIAQILSVYGNPEAEFGVTLPAVESLDTVASKYDPTIATLEGGFKETMNKFWAWIKKWAVKAWDTIKSLFSRLASLFTSNEKTIRRLAAALKDRKISDEKVKDKKFKIVAKAQWSLFEKALKDDSGVVVKASGDLSQFDKKDVKDFKSKLASLMSNSSIFTMDGETIKEQVGFSKKVEAKETDATSTGIGGWSLSDAQNVSGALAILSELRKATTDLNKIKVGLDALVKEADVQLKNAGKDAGEAEKTAKENAKARVKMVNIAIKMVGVLGKYANKLLGEFIRVQRAFLAITSK